MIKQRPNHKKYHGWNTALFALVFIAAFALIGYIFLLPDWTNRIVLPYIYLWMIGLGFTIYSFLITWLFIWLKVLTYDSFTFIVPLSIIFVIILVTYPLPWWARTLLVFGGIFITIPVNIIVGKKTD